MSFGTRHQFTVLGYEQITVSTTAVPFTTIPAGAKRALVVLESANALRWRGDGTAPTASVGNPLAGSGVLEVESILEKFKAIRSGAADAVMNVTYYD